MQEPGAPASGDGAAWSPGSGLCAVHSFRRVLGCTGCFCRRGVEAAAQRNGIRKKKIFLASMSATEALERIMAKSTREIHQQHHYVPGAHEAGDRPGAENALRPKRRRTAARLLGVGGRRFGGQDAILPAAAISILRCRLRNSHQRMRSSGVRGNSHEGSSAQSLAATGPCRWQVRGVGSWPCKRVHRPAQGPLAQWCIVDWYATKPEPPRISSSKPKESHPR